jgi:hypothetical protein
LAIAYSSLLVKIEGSGMDLHCPLIGEREEGWVPREGIILAF